MGSTHPSILLFAATQAKLCAGISDSAKTLLARAVKASGWEGKEGRKERKKRKKKQR